MKKKLKPTKTKIIVTFIILAVLSFGIYNLMWFRHIRKFDVFLNNEYLAEIKQTPSAAPEYISINGVETPYSYSRYVYNDPSEWDGWESHLYRDYDYNEYGYSYYISIPPYLVFDGHIQVVRQTEDYMINLIIRPRDWSYSINPSEIIEDISYGLGIVAVDKDWQLLGRQSYHATEESYIDALAGYEKYIEPISELLSTAKYVFGDALQ